MTPGQPERVIPGAAQHDVVRCQPGISGATYAIKIPCLRSGTLRRIAHGMTVGD